MPTSATVLLVDDEALLMMLMEDVFTEHGFRVVAAHDGAKAIAILEADENGSIDCLITDIRMPGEHSGWDVARRARELRPALPVIYLTGDSIGSFGAEGVPEGRVFGKPVAIEDIIEAVEQLLENPR